MLETGESIRNYTITNLVNEGVFCNSFFGTSDGSEYFIKEYKEPRPGNPVFSDFFNNQEIIINRLNALPSITEKYIDHFVEGDTYYQIKEKLSGINLEDWVKTHEDDEERLLLSIILCSTINIMHESGIVHQDLKPAQVMLVNDEKGKMTKLGYRPILSDFDWAIPDGNVANTVGTIFYMSPEHYLGDTPSKASDTFTVGVMLYELLVGKNPYNIKELNTEEEIKSNVLNGVICGEPREVYDQVPPAVSDIIVKTLDPNPKKRPSLDEIKKVLLASKSVPVHPPGVSKPPPAPPPPPPPPKAAQINIEAEGHSYIIYGDKAWGRNDLKMFFREITDKDSDPVYKYCDNDKPMLQFSLKDDGSFEVSSPKDTKNHFLLNGTKISSATMPVKKGDKLELYSTGLLASVCTFAIN